MADLGAKLAAATRDQLEIVKEIGRGAMGVVFLARQVSLSRYVAIKVLRPELQYDPEIMQRFQREVRTQASLVHTNILTILDVYKRGGLTYFMSPYVDGPNLRAYLSQNPRPPIPYVIQAVRQLAEALGYAHKMDVIHRDVKPENIIVDNKTGRMILMDFGIAKAMKADTQLTLTFRNIGSPRYMAPEQAEKPSEVDGRVDQYALGLIAYEMLAGMPAIDGQTEAEITYRHKYWMPDDIAGVRPDAPPELCAAIMRALAKDPADRFMTMDAFLAALPDSRGERKIVDEDERRKKKRRDGDSEHATSQGRTGFDWRKFFNSPVTKAIGFVLGVALVAGIVVLMYFVVKVGRS